MKNQTNNKPVYIMSLEASVIHEHESRGNLIKREFLGMIPYSLELMKLKEVGLKNIKSQRQPNKDLSIDVINVKFNTKVKSGDYILGVLNEKIDKVEDKLAVCDLNDKDAVKKLIDELLAALSKYKAFKEQLETESGAAKWNEVSSDELRENLYANGFTITDVDYDTGEIKSSTDYMVYKRSSSKSRTGQCLFIKKSLYKKMIKWSRMGLPFKKGKKVDLASLLAYESLVGSSLESTIQIHPNNILMVDDLDSKFNQVCSVVRKGKDRLLDSFKEEVEVSNSLFDGEALLESSYFPEGKSMMLLRQHMFKSAAFNTNIQAFLMDNCPEGINYDEWEIEDMFGQKMLAKDIHMITTPSSVKSLKFAHVFTDVEEADRKKHMFNYWKQLVESEGAVFGVCKNEKKSKRGIDEMGNILQQTSYQMLNSMPLTSDEIADLSAYEQAYIEKLKNDDDTYVNYLLETATAMNSNKMLAAIYKQNNGFAYSQVFRDQRKSDINKYVTHVKKGKLRLNGDYAVLLGNPVEFLYHAIGKLNDDLTVDKENVQVLKDNEVYTSLFNWETELVGFRNPHTSPSNVLVAKNTFNEEIAKYFNLSANIVVVNAIDFPILDKLSGADYDSDTALFLDTPELVAVAKERCAKYRVCINKVKSDATPYVLSNEDMAKIDNSLSMSQRYIGRIVNMGQEVMSLYWDKLNNGAKEEDIENLMKKVDVATVLSGIAIDMAKKTAAIDMQEEINHVVNNYTLNTIEVDKVDKNGEVVKDKEGKVEKKVIHTKPMFFNYISESKTIKERVSYYETPMDHLFKAMSNLDPAEKRENIEFQTFLEKVPTRNANSKQKEAVEALIEEMNNELKFAARIKDEEERDIKSQNIIDSYNEKVLKKKIKPDTMYIILKDLGEATGNLKLLNALYVNHEDVFLKTFKKA